MVVHIFGHPADMDLIMEIARKHDLFVVEDCAEAHGAEYRGRKTGSIGDVSCFSFYANKIITTGEGGMITTDDDEIAERARFLRNLAFDKARTYIHKEIGFNYRMTNIQAAIGLAQLENIKKHIEAKRRIAKTYNELLSKVEGIRIPVEEPWAKSVYWMYAILLEKSFGKERDEAREKLAKFGVETRCLFAPLHSQPCLKFLNDTNSYPISEDLYKRGFYLPSGIGLTREEIEKVVEAIKKIKQL